MRVHSAKLMLIRRKQIGNLPDALFSGLPVLAPRRAELCRAELCCAVFRHPAKLEAEHLHFGGLRSCGGVGTE